MSPSQAELLKHIIEECQFLLDACKDISKEEMIDDPVLSRAVVRSLEIIGEASKKSDPDFKTLHPEIEWRKMAATRDVMIHAYFGIDYDIVWDIVTDKIPELTVRIEAILKQYE
jgi:uncharacterized protein with HEPN domain